MNLKWLFWTGLLAVVVFFSAIYFGIKYDWVSGSQPSASSTSTIQKKTISQPSLKQPSLPKAVINSVVESPGNGVKPELIDETDFVSEDQNLLGSSELTIDEVVAQCQSLSESIGVPQQRLEQAINECVDRNSRHLASDEESIDSEREMLIREQCNVAITQRDLFSDEEVKLLVDECVASMSVN